MNKIKKSIEEELEYLVVDEDLKVRTLNKINPKRVRRHVFKPGYITKALTLVFSFTLVIVVSINFLFHTDPSRKTVPLRSNTLGEKDRYEDHGGLNPEDNASLDELEEELDSTTESE